MKRLPSHTDLLTVGYLPEHGAVRVLRRMNSVEMTVEDVLQVYDSESRIWDDVPVVTQQELDNAGLQ